ncbi:protein kinase C-binding protein 1-like [Ctenocephalides felis]|uniref:protein kinase C-binding protein 1-like n=1 Tax=Ctenocephalides felis TaxID=7515 RepID=UPI000E6E1E4E|nr:protein kinase C-binding protein 1-like [Ctenocephalides felis]
MTDYLGAEPFLHPVDKNEFPDYAKYVVHPMDLSKLEQNIKKNLYGSTEAFIADTKWILHNSIIYNSIHTKLTSVAKGIIKICKQEMNEIETCPECYLKANTHNDTNWFLEVCSHPHMLVWAKLKGYPYWPAKAMTVSNGNLVDVRFFGAHDKAWIPMKDCLLYSEKDPNFSDKGKRSDFIESLRELAIYVKNLEQKFGKFCHAPFKTPYPNDQAAIYSIMLPSYKFKSDIANKKIITKQKVCDITDKLLEDTKGNMKINNSLDEDSYIEGYDTEDEEALKDVSNESVDNVNDMKIKQTPLRARVRMRGGKINSTGKIKVIKIMKEHMEDQVIESPESMKTEFSSQKNDDNDTKATDTMMHNDSKTNKRKLSTNSLEVQEKKIKPDDIQETVSATPTKNVSKISKEKTPEISQSVSVLDNKSDKDEDVNCLVSEHELNPNKVAESNAVNTLTIVNQLPQISIMGVSKSNSVSNKLSPDTNKNTDDIKTNSIARVVLKKRNMIQENSSFVKRVSISKMNSNTETNNKSSVEEHALHRISNIEIKKASPCNAIVIPDSTISSLDVEIKTEPIDDYDIDKSYNASESTTEAYIDNSTKKQSARKSFPNKPKMNISPATKNNSKESGSINPASMVYIPQNSTAPKVEAKYQVSAASSNQQQTSAFVLPKRQEASIKICNTPRNNSSTIDNSTAFKSADLIEEHNYRHTMYLLKKSKKIELLSLSRYFQNLLHQTLVDFGNAGSTDAQVKKLQADIESLKWIHKQELSEIKHNTELILLEIRNSFEIDNAHNITKYKKKAEAERIRCVQEAKSKQWCVYCGKEAQFYCCWNTSYCDHECQRKHWNTHMTLCGQHRDTNQDDSSTLNINDSRSKIKTKTINQNIIQSFKRTPKLKHNLDKPTISNKFYLESPII